MIFSKGGSGARTKKNVPHYCSFSIPLGEVLCSMCIIHLGSSRHFFWGGCGHCLLFCPLFLATQTPCLKWPVLLPVPLSLLPVACCCLGPLILSACLHGGLERLSPSPLFPPVLLGGTGALGLTRILLPRVPLGGSGGKGCFLSLSPGMGVCGILASTSLFPSEITIRGTTSFGFQGDCQPGTPC